MKNIAEIADEIIRREGGYVDDRDDPGGATKYGVTLATLRRLKIDRNGDRRINDEDIRALTKAQVREIFIQEYFRRPQIDQMPEVLQASMFDMYVNAGANAVRILQRLLRAMGQPVAIDGMIGPQTMAAAKQAGAIAPRHLADAYGIARRNYYYRLADRRIRSRKYARRRDGGKGGWIIRAESFISPQYHLTEAEHRTRISAWG